MSAKVTKTFAKYTNKAAKGRYPCRDCTMYRDGSCTYVSGSIKPGGHCRFFKLKAVRAT